jgi:hypothetical protein
LVSTVPKEVEPVATTTTPLLLDGDAPAEVRVVLPEPDELVAELPPHPASAISANTANTANSACFT